MKQNQRFDNILNECLDRILRGESVEECLGSYPEQARELEPLLRIALATNLAAHIQPHAEFKARARYEFTAAIRDLQAKKNRRWSLFDPTSIWRTGWAIALIVILVIVLGGGSTVVLAGNSMPDSALYPVKLVAEQAQLAVTPSTIGKTELNAKFAERRADEIAYLAGKGNAQEVQIAAQRLNTNLVNITNLAKKDNEDNKAAGNSTTFSTDAPVSAGNSDTASGNAPQPMVGAATQVSPPAAPPGVIAAPMAVPSATTSQATMPPGIKAAAPNPEPATPAGAGPQIRPGVTAPAPPTTFVEAPRNAPNTSSHNNSGNSRDTNNAKITDHDKLKQIIIDNYNDRQARLNEALEKASPDLRPAIRQAISKSQDEFEKALKNLDSGNQGVR